jgi:division/cell wall cluster transcriptional repressor MraZ
MSDFLGTYLITMEKTGRIRLPQALSDFLSDSDSVVLVYGERPCIEIYPPDVWRVLLDDFRKQPRPWSESFEWHVRQKTRSFKEVEIKQKGRLTVPQEHRTYARIEGGHDVLVHGMLDHIELWSQDRFKDAEEIRRAQQLFGR